MARGWILGFHLIGVVLWMGGLLTFSRILGYHSKELPSARPRFTFIEGRINWLVAVPGAVLTIVFGMWLVRQHGEAWFRVALWLHIKLALVVGVVVIHVLLTVKTVWIAITATTSTSLMCSHCATRNQARPCCTVSHTPKTMVSTAPGADTSQLSRPSMNVKRGRTDGSSFEW